MSSPSRRHLEGLGHRENQIGLAQAPLRAGTGRSRHGIGRVPLWCAGLRPCPQQRDLMRAEAAAVAKGAEARNRPPRRHEPLAGHVAHHRVPPLRVLEALQREGRDAVLPVALDTVGLQQRRDVARVGDLLQSAAGYARPLPDMVKAADRFGPRRVPRRRRRPPPRSPCAGRASRSACAACRPRRSGRRCGPGRRAGRRRRSRRTPRSRGGRGAGPGRRRCPG